jgi:NADH-quinone oxidoreductase subunit H
LPTWVWNFFSNHPWIIMALVFHGVVLGTVAYLILLERKTASWVQDRLGPNRVGLDFGILPFKFLKNVNGLGQPLADGLKFIVKEDYRPKHVDRILFTIAPAVMIITIIISIAVLPWGGWKQGAKLIDISAAAPGQTDQIDAIIRGDVPDGAQDVQKTGEVRLADEPGKRFEQVSYRWPFQIAQLNIGVLFILGALSLAVYGVVVGGWASNNKYSFLGALRATANMISYEIPLGLSVLCIVLMFGTLDMNKIVELQCHNWLGVIPAWNVFSQPLAFVLFLICIHAEANRAPFDLAEAEQELVGGYHTEYSAMRFALFFLAEYAGMVTTSAVCVALFFGGWDFPGLRGHPTADTTGYINPAVTGNLIICFLRAAVFFGKTLVIIFIFMWVRWSLPRFRFDQLMMLAWRALIPISLGLFMMTGVCLFLTRDPARFPHAFGRMGGQEALVLLLIGNGGTLLVTVLLSLIIPAAPATNRRLVISNSRFRRTPLPGMPVRASVLNVAAAMSVAIDPIPASTGQAG